MDEADGAGVEFFELVLGRVLACEFDKITAFQEASERLFLVEREVGGLVKFVDELFGGSFGRVEVELFFDIDAHDIGNQRTKEVWVVDGTKRLVELSAGFTMRWYRGVQHRGCCRALTPIPPEEISHRRCNQERQRHP